MKWAFNAQPFYEKGGVRVKDPDVFSGGFLILFAIAGYIYSNTIDIVDVIGMREDFYPKFLFVTLFLCGLHLVIKGCRKEVKDIFPKFEYKQLLLIAVVMVAYIFIFEYVGYIVGTVLFLVAAMYVFGERRKKYLATVPFIATATIYLLFTKVFLIVL